MRSSTMLDGLPTDAVRPVDLATGDGLQALADAVAGARVVLLGEATHGDGATFAAKAAVVQYLHEHAGFDVLAWEAGLYDCRRMDDAFAAGVEPIPALSLGVHQVWVTEQVRPLAEHISRSWTTGRPLRQVGFDTQFSSVTSVETVGADVVRWLAECGVDASAADGAAIGALAAHSIPICEQLADGPRLAARDVVERLLAAVRERAPDAFVVRVLDDVLRNDDIYTPLNAWVREQKARTASENYADWSSDADPFYKEHFGMRDLAMARNLLHDVALRPDSRFVCWLANGHAQRNMSLVGNGDPRFDGLLTMGSVVCEALGDAAYVIVTTSHSGTMNAGRKVPGGQPLQPAAPGSLEDVLHRTGRTTAFLDVRSLDPASPWRAPTVWRSWGEEQIVAPLPEVTDGVLYLDEQRPCTAVGVS